VNTLRGKRALVTGGSRGIGAATALLFAEYGVDVAIGYRSRKEDATRVVDEAKARGVRSFAYAHDIGSREGAETLVRGAVADLGALDFFVGNAGIWPSDDVPVTDMDDMRWRRTMLENVVWHHREQCRAGMGGYRDVRGTIRGRRPRSHLGVDSTRPRGAPA
jgi:3-oxoacyl-[acyl-carrier protein] reductase